MKPDIHKTKTIHTAWKISIFLSIIILSCKISRESTHQEKSENDLKQEVSSQKKIQNMETEATVIDLRGLDGCSFLLRVHNQERLEPINLPEEMKVNGLAVMVTYEYHQGASICMAGKMIKITHIRKKHQ